MENVEVSLILAVFLVSTSIAGLMTRYASRLNLVDVPNQRSSHTMVTPRGGGLGIVASVLGAVVYLWSSGKLADDAATALLVAGSIVAVVGFLDDHRSIPARWRFLSYLAAAVFAVLQLGGMPPVAIGQVKVEFGGIGSFALIIFVVWFTNAFNFMDGIDGISASEAVCVAGGALAIALPHYGAISSLLGILIAASLGFLIWNWPPAKIFLGDVGSIFLGFTLAVVGIISIRDGSVTIWSWLILGGVFIVDATYTLVVRILRKENWTSAHRSHAYQVASRRFNSHLMVTGLVIVVNIFWLLPVAFLADRFPGRGWWLVLVSWLPIVMICSWLGAGKPDAERAM